MKKVLLILMMGFLSRALAEADIYAFKDEPGYRAWRDAMDSKRALGTGLGDDPDAQVWAANKLSNVMLGINSYDGAIFNGGRPMAPANFLRLMQEIAQEAKWNHQQGRLSEGTIYKILPKRINLQNIVPCIALMTAEKIRGEDAQKIVYTAMTNPSEIEMLVCEDFRNLQMKDPEQAAQLAPLLHLMQPSMAENWLVEDMWRAVMRTLFGTLTSTISAITHMVERNVLDDGEYQRRREREAVWRQAFAPKQKEWFGLDRTIVDFATFCGNIIYTASATVPFNDN